VFLASALRADEVSVVVVGVGLDGDTGGGADMCVAAVGSGMNYLVYALTVSMNRPEMCWL